MFNYLIADLRRIALRIPHALALIGIYAILVIMLIFGFNSEGWNSVSLVTMTIQYINFLTILLGLVELNAVFSDDFKTKTIQVAIGIGISRWRVILTKFLELAILVFVDIVVVLFIAIVCGGFMNAFPTYSQIVEIWSQLFSVWLGILGYMSLTMIIIFLMQGTGIATILYLALSSGIFNMVIGLLSSFEIFESLHLQKYTLTSLLGMFGSQLTLGSFNFSMFIGIIFYIAIGYGMAVAIFRKRELDF